MKYIIANGIKCHWDFKLLSSDFLAITLFGHVFFNRSKEWLERYVKTIGGTITLNHERIHVMQAESFKTKYLGFYLFYLWYWFIGLFKCGVKNNASYYMIPFEREAYANETNFTYDKTNWKEYT